MERSGYSPFRLSSRCGRATSSRSGGAQNGPVRPFGRITIEPSGAGCRYTLELDFKGVGLGKLIAPLARRDARRHVPEDLARFKEKVESGAAAKS